jgi:acyl-CoA reductase-like NAD-dependent aldehyde dehydrogenase
MTNTLKLISPVNGEVYMERPVASRADVDAAVAKARAAQKDWAARPLAERVALVRAGIARLRALNDEIAARSAGSRNAPTTWPISLAKRWRQW